MCPKLACVFATVLIITASARASVDDDLSTIYAVAPAKVALDHEGEITRRLEPLLRKQARYLSNELRPWKDDPCAMLLTSGGSHEADIRPNAHTAYGLAVLARTLDDNAARDKAIAILRFLLASHGAAGGKCADGKQWNSQWQSALWAESAGRAAWLLWDDLDPEQRWLAARMICDEAARFIDAPPPAQVANDTKAEENAWNSTILSLAHCMFPRHSNHARFGQAAIRWQLSAFATSKDVASVEVIEGKPLRDWVTAANLHDDYTLENHNRVHPDYMTATRLNVAQKLTYDWAGVAAPRSIYFNVPQLYASLKKLALPDGGWIYPNAQDWHLHRNADWFDAHVQMALLFDDAQAARLMRLCLDTAERMIARSENGGVYADGETFFASSQGMVFELYCDAYLFLRHLGEGAAPVSEETLWQQLAGTHVFDAGKFAVVRSDHSIATFSWGRQVMGMVMPLRRDLLLTPNDRGLIGDIGMQRGRRDEPVVKIARTMELDGGFAVAGTLARAGGAVEQRFAFVALPDGRAVYVDSLKGDAELHHIDLGLLGVLNDTNWVHHTGRRTLDCASGQQTFTATSEPLELSSPWYHLDGLGIACLETTGRQVYHATPSPIRARLEQRFVLNAVAPDAANGAQTALVFFPNVDASAARQRAGQCKLTRLDSQRLFIKLDDGKTIRIDLEDLTVELK